MSTYDRVLTYVLRAKRERMARELLLKKLIIKSYEDVYNELCLMGVN